MSDPVEQGQADDPLGEQVDAARSRSRRLQHEVSEIAGRIARTEDDVARVHDQVAVNGVSDSSGKALEEARHARSFAEHERSEQRRWAPDVEQD